MAIGGRSLLRPYEVLGAHFTECDSVPGVNFRVWAPNAKRVSLVGDFNYWDGRRHPMRSIRQVGYGNYSYQKPVWGNAINLN